jgi:hypothetical protein
VEIGVGRYLKIEFLAVVMIAIMLSVSYLIKIKNEKANLASSDKEFEVHNSLIREVNESELVSTLKSDYMVQKKGNLQMIRINYKGETVKELQSKYGRSIADTFFLDVNVTMQQDNGYYYEAEHAIYKKKEGFFYVTSPFVGYLHRGNIIKGTNLKYNINEKITEAQNVDARFFTRNKEHPK